MRTPSCDPSDFDHTSDFNHTLRVLSLSPSGELIFPDDRLSPISQTNLTNRLPFHLPATTRLLIKNWPGGWLRKEEGILLIAEGGVFHCTYIWLVPLPQELKLASECRFENLSVPMTILWDRPHLPTTLPTVAPLKCPLRPVWRKRTEEVWSKRTCKKTQPLKLRTRVMMKETTKKRV